MRIIHNGQKYELDVEAAKASGALKLAAITSFEIGDVFCSAEGSAVLITGGYGGLSDLNAVYHLAGLNGVKPYSDFGAKGTNKEDMLAYLNRRKFRFMGNINKRVGDMLNEFRINVKKP